MLLPLGFLGFRVVRVYAFAIKVFRVYALLLGFLGFMFLPSRLLGFML